MTGGEWIASMRAEVTWSHYVRWYASRAIYALCRSVGDLAKLVMGDNPVLFIKNSEEFRAK